MIKFDRLISDIENISVKKGDKSKLYNVPFQKLVDFIKFDQAGI